MRRALLTAGLAAMLVALGAGERVRGAAAQSGAPASVTRAPGGSVKVDLSPTIALNGDSSLQREWIAVHSRALPVELVETPGIEVVYNRGTPGYYQYGCRYFLEAKQPLAAYEVRFLLFNLWGDHVITLSATTVKDLPVGKTDRLQAFWRVFSELDASRHYASIAYIARVRTADGRVIEADPAPVIAEARKLSKKFAPQDLEPTPRPDSKA